MIDLHLHTTASDGTLSPTKLVERARAAGIRTLSVTDHDTMAGVGEAAETAITQGLEFLPGIEITAVLDRRDVHILAYFLDPDPPGMAEFLLAARADRSRRARETAVKLANLGAPIEIEELITEANAKGHAVARPMVARALVEAGHVPGVHEAFDRWLADGRPAYVARQGASPAEVVRLVARAGGVSALAHPGLLGKDELIPSLAQTGLGAIEVYHSAHGTAAKSHYAKLAQEHKLATCGGSDFHGDDHHRAKNFGEVGLPREKFMELFQRILLAHSVAFGEQITS